MARRSNRSAPVSTSSCSRNSCAARYKFRGMVLSDWAITQDCVRRGASPANRRRHRSQIAMPWGVESLTKTQRFAKGMNAGIDQFGGVDDGTPFVDAVKDGTLAGRATGSRQSRGSWWSSSTWACSRIRMVDAAKAATVVGSPEKRRAAILDAGTGTGDARELARNTDTATPRREALPARRRLRSRAGARISVSQGARRRRTLR